MYGTGAASDDSMTVERLLFGGALTCQIPAHWGDLANRRQVPDNQECWQGVSTASAAAAAVLVVEILELQPVDANQAASFFFNDLAESNGCDPTQLSFAANEPVVVTNTDMALVSSLVAQQPAVDAILCSGSGFQRVTMGRATNVAENARLPQEMHHVSIQLAVFRLPQHATDLLVTLSTPSAAIGDDDHGDNCELQRQAELFRKIISSLQIRDWSLFG